MSMQVVNRNNVVAGLFLIGSILLAVVISFLLSDLADKFGDKKSYVFRYPTSVGVSGLKPGANVTFGGLEVGKVSSIDVFTELDPNTGIGVVIAHDVIVLLNSELILFEDAFGDISLPLLGGVSTINIPSAGTGSYLGGPIDSNQVLDEGEILRGRFSPSILTQLGFTNEDAKRLRESIDDVHEGTGKFKIMAEKLASQFDQGVDDGASTIANVRVFTENLNKEDGWAEKVDGVFANVDSKVDKIGGAVDEVQVIVTNVQEIVADGKPLVANILENVEITTERLKTESMAQIDELLNKGSLALGSYKEFGYKANLLLDENRPKINSTLDSAESIGVHGELFIEELRTQPWRIMNKPSKKELAREPIYQAARDYADAVSDLRKASEALDAAVARVAEDGSSEITVDLVRISAMVEAAYGRYEQAEVGLLEKLRISNP